MKIAIDYDVHKWLVQMKLLKPSGPTSVNQLKANVKIELDEAVSRQFMNAVKFSELIQAIVNQRVSQGEKLQPFFSPDSVKDMSTPGIRLYNWNIISDAFSKLNIPFDNDIKGLIIQGDKEMINEVLKDVMETENSRNEKLSRVSNRTKNYLNESNQNQINNSMNTPSLEVKKSLQQQNNSLDEEVTLGDIDARKPLNECKTLLEFFLVGLSKHLQLRPKQTAALLSNGNKYLAHVIVKGAKNDFTPISNWLAEVYANLSRVYGFMSSSDVNVGIFLSTLKPGLLSKEQEVALWTLRVYNKVFFQLAEMEMHALGYEWFTRENGGLTACLMSLKRHPQIIQQVCDVFSQVARYNLNDFFTVQLRKQIDFGKEYLETINLLLPNMVQSKSMKEDLSNQHLVQFWSTQSVKLAENDLDVSGQIVGLKYLTLFWSHYPLIFEEDTNLCNQFLFLMKKASRERSQVLKYFSMSSLFNLLDMFAKDRNPYAAILYKKLTFSLIENFEDLELRDLMLQNFLQIFASYSTIPVEILLEPFIKQVQVNEVQLNLSDMSLLKVCCMHPKTKVRVAIQLLDLLSKVYLNSIILAQVAFPQLQLLLSRFIESEPLQEYAFKLAKVALGLYYASIQSKREQHRVSDLSYLTALQQQNNETQILNAQKRAQIVELVKYIVKLGVMGLNDQIKQLIVHFYLELKQLGKDDKGIMAMLSLFGSPLEIVDEFKRIWDQEKLDQQKELNVYAENEFQEKEKEIINQVKVKAEDDPFKQMKEEEQQQEKIFLEQHGVGLKKKMAKKPSLGPQKVDQKVLENIAQIKMKRDEDQLQKQQEEEDKQKRDQLLKRKAKEEIEKRNKLAINEEGAKEDIANHQVQNVELMNIEEEEKRELDSMMISLKKNQKSMRYLFQKYSNTTNQAQKKQLFGELQEQFEVIQSSDIWRMCKDYGVSDFISREDVVNLVKAVNVKILKNDPLNSLEYEGFQKFMVQVAVRIYSDPMRDMRKHTVGQMVDSMIYSFGLVAKKKNENHLIFHDPSNLNIDPDREEILQLNNQLLYNPETIIPQKYQKFPEKIMQLDFTYKRNLIQNLPDSWLDSHEIVNDLIAEIFKVDCIEPRSQVSTIQKVKHKKFEPSSTKNSKKIKQPVPTTNNDLIAPPENEDKRKRDNSQQKKKVTKNQIPNKALEDKNRQKEEEEFKRLEQEEKRRKHQEKLKEQYLKMKAERDQEELKKKEEERLQQIEKSEREKRDQDRIKKEAEDRKFKLKEYKEKLDEQKKQKEQQEIDEKKLKEEIKRKERDQFMKKQQQEVQKVLEDKKKQFKSKEDQEKKKEKEKQDELVSWKKNVQTMLKEESEQRQREKEAQRKILQLYQNPEVSEVFNKAEKYLQIVYHAYQEYSDWKIENAEQDKNLLQFKGFTNFLSQFNIYPAIISTEQGQQVYHQISRERERQQQVLNEKNGFSEAPPNGMSYREFELALLRVAILGQKYFDTISEKYESEMKALDMYNLIKEQKKQDDEQKKASEEDVYSRVEQTSKKTVEGLLYYMDLPGEKSELQSKLRALKLEYQKVVAPREKKKSTLDDKYHIKQVLEQKVGEEVVRTNRNMSANRKVISAKDKPKRNNELASVDEKDLKAQKEPNFQNVGVIGPDGKPENWKVEGKQK